jgi:E3 ubiquitin-protein ligase makorin
VIPHTRLVTDPHRKVRREGGREGGRGGGREGRKGRTRPTISSQCQHPLTHLSLPPSLPPQENLIKAYKEQMNKKPCRYFTHHEGNDEASLQSCPFGSSCFYAHLKRDGTPLTPPRLRTRVGEEGRVEVVQEVKLSDFLMQGRR